jgi:hypothetical protein
MKTSTEGKEIETKVTIQRINETEMDHLKYKQDWQTLSQTRLKKRDVPNE